MTEPRQPPVEPFDPDHPERVPALLVAAPASGQGKTTVMIGLARALQRQGLDLRCFKAGPDYLDPTWHRAASGRPSRNLDAWMTGPEGVRASFSRGARGGDLALVEGMMGLFDGRDPRGLDGSGAELALLLRLPVLVVLDASAMARTAAAVVQGLAVHVPGVRVAGVIMNRVGSVGHGELLRTAMESVPSVAFLGAIPEDPSIRLPERHLGLHAAGEDNDPRVEAITAHVQAHVDLDKLRQLASPVPLLPLPSPAAVGPRVRIGVALDEAFSFYYQDNLELLAAAGAELVPFSPLRDPDLPPGLRGLVLGGGYPELHAEALAKNASMRAAIASFSGPVYAECGGLMYLGERLDDHPMCGLLPLKTRMRPQLQTLGYREVRTTRPTPLGPAGTVFRGHEFHHSELVEPPPLAPAYRISGLYGAADEGWARGQVLGSYVHAHFGSNPTLAPAFVAACAEHGAKP